MPPATLENLVLLLAFVLIPCALPLYLIYRDARRRQALPWEARSTGSLSRGELEALIRRVLREEWQHYSPPHAGSLQSDTSTPPSPGA